MARDYLVDGMKIDGATGILVELISCPGCGRRYRRGTYVCVNCEECKTCHKNGPCRKPEYVKVDDEYLQRINL